MSTQDNSNLLQQLKLDFKRTTNWNKYCPKTENKVRNPYLDYLVDPSFQRINKLFALSFEDNANKSRHTGYFLAKVKLEDDKVIIDGISIFDQPIKDDIKT